MGISVNGPSGIDTASLIEQLVELEYSTKVDPVETRKAAYEVAISAYSEMKSLISDLTAKAKAVDEIADFNIFTATTSDSGIATITGSTGCQTGSYSLSVYHTATAEKLVSIDNLIASQTSSLSSLGISTGTFSINGAEVTIDEDDTLQDVRMKINNLTDSKGVTASVLRLSDNNYRLVLTSGETGENGVEYRDIDGTVLQDLGIISSADGEKGIVAQKIQSDRSVQTILSGISAGSIIRISGKDHDGTSISGQITTTGTMSDDDYLSAIEDIFHDTVIASFESDGTLTVIDKISGNSALELSLDSFGDASAPRMECTAAGQCGKNVLSCGSNAYLSIDGMYIESESNDVDDVIDGATVNLYGTTNGETTELTIERDVSAIADKIKALVESYNTLYTWVKEQTRYGTTSDDEDNTGDSSDGSLAGDMAAKSIMNTISAVFREQFSSVTGKFQNIYAIGITTDYTTGEYTLDTDKLESALASNFSDVTNLFVTGGSSSENGIVLGRSTGSTKSGTYDLEKTTDGYRIRLAGSDEWYTSSSVTGDIVSFDEGPATGLSLTVPDGTLNTGETAIFRYSKGFGDLLEEVTGKLTSSSSDDGGMIALRQKSLTTRIEDADNRVERLTTQIEAYRERLTQQYAAMEQALSTLQTQMDSMLSALGESS